MNRLGASVLEILADRRFLLGFSALLLVATAIYYFFLLPVGALALIDEYWTLDRVSSFEVHGDWFTVHSENIVNFNKPPLQYWLSALVFAEGSDIEFALRLPSYIFALLLLPLTGLVAFQLWPRLLVVPCAMLILASSERYWESGMSALLDAGATFFATAALAATFAAMRQPKWWYAVALLAGLGSLQKMPLALGFVAIAALAFAWQARFVEGDARKAYINRHFAIAVLILLTLLFSWPAIQFWKHGQAYLQVAYVEQMWDRFAGGADSGGFGLSMAGLRALFRGQPLLEVPTVLAILALPFFIRRAEALTCTGLFLLYLILSALAGDRGSPRYAVLLYPLMAASLAALMAKYLDAKALPVVVAASLLLGGPFKSAEAARLLENRQARYVDFLTRIGEAVHPDETFMRCRWKRGKAPIFPGAISYYASRGKPVLTLTGPAQLAKGVAPPFRGLCTIAEYADLESWLKAPEKIETYGNYVHWTAKAARAQPDVAQRAGSH